MKILYCFGFILLPTFSFAGNFYTSLHGELLMAEDADFSRNGGSIGEAGFDIEYAAGASLGYQPRHLQSAWANSRFEIELTYREADYDDFSNAAIAPAGLGGSIETYVGMANAYYDFYNETNWTPYVGAGLGIAQQNVDSLTLQLDDEDTVLAYQAMAGVAHKIDPYENVHVGFGYRYFGTEDPEITDFAGNSVETEHGSHSFEAFLRIGF